MSLANIRHIVQSEIKNLTAELKRLNSLLSQLGESITPNSEKPSHVKKTRGIAKVTENPEAVLALIKDAKKVNAVSLGHQLRKAGLAKVSTTQLIELGVKVTGKKGGTTYSYAG